MTAQQQKVHIGVSRALQDKLVQGGEGEIAHFIAQLGLKDVRTDRLAAFGILTGIAAQNAIETMTSVPGVDFVERDSVKKAL